MTLSDRDRKIMLAIIPIVVLLGYWFLLLSPQRKEADAAGTQLTEAQQHRDEVQGQARQLESAKASFASAYTTLVRLGKAIPTKVDMPSLIVQLDDAARGTGISFSQIKTGTRTETPAAPAAPATNSGSSSNGSKPVDAGGQPAQSAPGSAVESANNASKTSDQANQAAQQSSGVDASTSTSAKKGGLPIGGGEANGKATSANTAPGLDSVPLEFRFDGSFFDLADFFHRMKRFVRVTNKNMQVHGRLMTIDGLVFKAAEDGFPKLTAEVKATIWLSPKQEGQTAGATPAGPATTPAGSGTGSGGIAGDQSASSSSSTPTAAVTP
jgi:type II secretion system (T2SS) protein M